MVGGLGASHASGRCPWAGFRLVRMNWCLCVQEIVHNLREIAAVEHAGVPALLTRLAGELLPSLCAVVSVASGMFHSSVERCIARILQVEHGITHAREMAASPGMGGAVKALLTEPYLRKIASMPAKSTFDVTIDEDY